MIKFTDVSITNKEIQQEIINVLESGQFIGGSRVDEFSRLWAQKCKAGYCVPTSSGTSALYVSLKVLFPKGSYIIIPEYSFAATLFAVIEAGMIPIFCPVNSKGLIDQDICLEIIKNLEKEEKGLGVIPVHLYGQVIQIKEEILRSALVVEDACQSHGMSHLQGVAQCYSFYPSKNLGAAGDAGAIVVDISSLADRMWEFISYGDPKGQKYIHNSIGNNLRMDAIQATILSEKLKRGYLEKSNGVRCLNAATYAEIGIKSFVNPMNNAYHLYPILVEDRERFKQYMEGKVEVGEQYPYTLPGLLNKKEKPGKNAQLLADHVVTLPLYPLDYQGIEYISDLILKEFQLVDGMYRGKN